MFKVKLEFKMPVASLLNVSAIGIFLGWHERMKPASIKGRL